MPDFTTCRGCPKNSRGEEYCPDCEAAIKADELRAENKQCRPPVRAVHHSDRSELVDQDGRRIVTLWAKGPVFEELARDLAEYVSDFMEENNE
jgi:hypothetical protein